MIRVGELLNGRYEVQQRVGMGGMADVYKAMDKTLNRYVAIKVLKAEFSLDKSFVAKFQAEARAAAGLSHPNIVSVYDVAEENGSYFIVMELIDGITLKQYIEKKGRLSIKEATSIAIQVSTGIEAAHQNNIIHRDIKPQNIIISKDGKVKIADFGIAKAISTNTNTISSNVMGSVHYSSPEQSRGGYLDAKSDIYSLGIVMFEMVTGRVPFDGDTTVAVAIQHLQDDIPLPREIVPEIPIGLEKIILKCTAKSPNQRYAKAGDLVADLKQSLITPNDDFVDDVSEDDVEGMKTSVISRDEIRQIKTETNRAILGNKQRPNSFEKEERSMKNRNKKYNNEYYDDEISPKSEKIMGIITIVAAIAIMIIVILIIVKISKMTASVNSDNDTKITAQDNSEEDENNDSMNDNDKTDDDSVTENDNSVNTDEEIFEVPSVVGKQLDEAVSILETKGLIVLRTPDRLSSALPMTVISQNPIGTEVKAGDTIELKYVPAKEKVTIPDGLVGMGEEEVSATLTALGLTIKPEFKYDETIEAGKVISVNPAGGSEVDKGTAVALTVSKGAEELKAPKLLGLSKKEALILIESAGLKLGNVDENVSDKYKKGKVMAQDIKPGAIYKKGDTINITMSLGIQDTAENFRWVWSGKISEPDDYTGKEVKIVLEQTAGANIKTKTLIEGSVFDFNSDFTENALIPGVSDGKIYIYEKTASGEYTLLAVRNITFKMLDQ